jgi:hypothetical protein
MTELKNAGVDVTPEVSSVPLLPLLYLSLLFLFPHILVHRLYSPSGSSIGIAESAEYDGFHRGTWTGRGRCGRKEEVRE